VYISVWHNAFDNTFNLISNALGGATWISITDKGFLGSNATAALQVMTLFDVN